MPQFEAAFDQALSITAISFGNGEAVRTPPVTRAALATIAEPDCSHRVFS
jgi:hypothetical protein